MKMQISTIVHTVSTTDGKTRLEIAGRPLFQLNPVGAAIWASLSDGISTKHIIGQIAAQFGVPEERVANDVDNFIKVLKENLLVQDYSRTPDCRAELVWSKGIAARCDWRIPDEFPPALGFGSILEPLGHMVPPDLLSNLISSPEVYAGIRNGDLVWVRFTWLKSFIKQVLPLIKAKFVLATADSDVSVPSPIMAETLEILGYPNVLHWYAQNCDGIGFLGRMSPLPIGVDFHTLSERPLWGESISSPQQQEQTLRSIRSELHPARERIRKVYIDFAWQPVGFRHPARRQRIIEKVLTNECVHFQGKALRRSQLWRKWGKYAFVLSPHGQGLDCHRTWEALACGHIVLVPSSPLDGLYEGLPVIPIKDWNEITPENLEGWLECYSGCEIDDERLKSRYWIAKMRMRAHEKIGSTCDRSENVNLEIS
jgi:hypothetical protein